MVVETSYSAELRSLQEVKETVEELQQQLRRERLLLRTIVDNLPTAIYAKDLEGRKILANRFDLDNAGVETEAEVLGKNDFDLFPKHIAEQFYRDDAVVLKRGQSIVDREELLAEDNGEEKWLRTSKLPLLGEQGEILGLVGFGQDISLEKRLEKENAEASIRIHEQQQMVEQMIADLAAIPEKIGNLVNGITYVAKQTKMVSINATIEAARVGDLGRGFQVVAEEVGQLSDRSTEAATQVREAIAEVESLINKILDVWAKGNMS
ncbi:MAG TPA: methyl-accepting chemotaxis protein [Limnochordia bacterium]|nr:methyl-accepting chemotaxis protein [Limnochordia bacterium]